MDSGSSPVQPTHRTYVCSLPRLTLVLPRFHLQAILGAAAFGGSWDALPPGAGVAVRPSSPDGLPLGDVEGGSFGDKVGSMWFWRGRQTLNLSLGGFSYASAWLGRCTL